MINPVDVMSTSWNGSSIPLWLVHKPTGIRIDNRARQPYSVCYANLEGQVTAHYSNAENNQIRGIGSNKAMTE